MASEELDGPALCDPATVAMAERIRDDWHPHLAEARIRYVFIPQGPVKNGTVRLGVAKRQSDLNSLLTGADFVIILSHDRWQDMEPGQREGLLDHELCHCIPKLHPKTGEHDGWGIRHHDIEEFAEVVNRHGLLTAGQRDYGRKTRRQLELFIAFELDAEPAP